MKRALEGIRVLDLTRVLAGPYCGMILGDLAIELESVTGVPVCSAAATYRKVMLLQKQG